MLINLIEFAKQLVGICLYKISFARLTCDTCLAIRSSDSEPLEEVKLYAANKVRVK